MGALGWLGRWAAVACAGMALLAFAGCAGSGGTGLTGADVSNVVPTVSLQAFPSTGAAPLAVNLDGTGSWTQTGGNLSFDWDFDGDGTWDATSATATQSHTYTTVGSYITVLRAKDPNGKFNLATIEITVTAAPITPQQKPVAQLGAFPTSGVAPLTVNLDSTGSWSSNAGPLNFKYDYDGDGTVDLDTSANFANHIYTAAGVYTAQVTVTDQAGASAVAQITITVTAPSPQDLAPVGALGAYPVTGTAPLVVTLDASGSWARDGKPLSYAYDVNGDGVYDVTTSRNMLVHTYTAAGTFTPKLRVTDDQGHKTEKSGPTVTVQ